MLTFIYLAIICFLLFFQTVLSAYNSEVISVWHFVIGFIELFYAVVFTSLTVRFHRG